MSPERDELSLFRDLFDGYDKRIRPVLRKEDNVTVTLGISMFQLIDLVSGVCLRTVHTNIEVFYAVYYYAGKVDLSKGY